MPRLNCWLAAAWNISMVEVQELPVAVEVPEQVTALLRPQYFVFLISDTLKRDGQES